MMLAGRFDPSPRAATRIGIDTSIGLGLDLGFDFGLGLGLGTGTGSDLGIDVGARVCLLYVWLGTPAMCECVLFAFPLGDSVGIHMSPSLFH